MIVKNFGIYKRIHNKFKNNAMDPNITKTLLNQMMSNNSNLNNFNPNQETQTNKNETDEQNLGEKENENNKEANFTTNTQQMYENSLTNEPLPLFPK